MANNDWSRIKEILGDAIHRKPEELADFLDEACGGNDSLRREVETLLSSLNNAGSFMEHPAFEFVNEELEALTSGQKLGHYEIVRKVGEGGMGIVYLGRDTKLDRHVALKVLNKRYERNEDNTRRFVREAKAASALNHPNILTIFEIGEVEGSHYIVSEYTEGLCFRLRLHVWLGSAFFEFLVKNYAKDPGAGLFTETPKPASFRPLGVARFRFGERSTV